MTITLTPTEVETITGMADVTAGDIAAGSSIITEQTGYTPSNHVDIRLFDEDVVKQAWAIVAARVHVVSRSVGAEAVNSETQGDYSVSVDVATAEKYQADMMAGLPRQLLGEEIGFSTSMRAGQRLVGSVSESGYWWL